VLFYRERRILAGLAKDLGYSDGDAVAQLDARLIAKLIAIKAANQSWIEQKRNEAGA
jgi:hypothetical protein